MSIHQHATLEDTIYFWFAANDTSGSGNDGVSAAADVRLAGGAAADAPILSPSPTLLSHANYPAGCYEVAVAATTANGFAATNTYGVFCTLAVDGQNPSGFIGSFTLDPIIANIKELVDSAQSATDLKDFADAGYDPGTNKVQGVVLVDTTTTLSGHTAQTGDSYAIVNHASYGNAQLVRSTTPANTLDVAATGEAGLDFDNIKQATGATTLNNVTVPTVTTLTGHTAQTGDSYARLGAPAGASVSADIASILSKLLKYVQLILRSDAAIATDNATELAAINADGGSGAGDFDNTTEAQEAIRDRGDAAYITAVGFSTHTAANVRVEMDSNSTQLAAIVADTNELQTDDVPGLIAALNDPTAGAIADAVWDEAATGHTDAGKAGAQLWTDIDAILVDTGTTLDTKLNDVQGGTFNSVTDSLEAIRDRGDTAWITATSVTVSDKTGFSLSAAGIQAIWDALTSALTTVGSIGKLLVDNVNATISSRSSHTAANVRTEMDSNSTQLAAIVADTNELQGDLTNGGRLDLIIDAILADTNELQSDDVPGLIAALNDLSAAQINAEVVDVLRTDTTTELAAVPAASPALHTMVQFIYMKIRNKETSTASAATISNDAGAAIGTSTLSDDGTTFTKGKYA